MSDQEMLDAVMIDWDFIHAYELVNGHSLYICNMPEGF